MANASTQWHAARAREYTADALQAIKNHDFGEAEELRRRGGEALERAHVEAGHDHYGPRAAGHSVADQTDPGAHSDWARDKYYPEPPDWSDYDSSDDLSQVGDPSAEDYRDRPSEIYDGYTVGQIEDYVENQMLAWVASHPPSADGAQDEQHAAEQGHTVETGHSDTEATPAESGPYLYESRGYHSAAFEAATAATRESIERARDEMHDWAARDDAAAADDGPDHGQIVTDADVHV